jgi:Zn-dependent peptidase ImmA (M78 family)
MDEAEAIPSGPKLKEVRHAAAALLKSLKITEPPVNLNIIYQQTKKTVDLIIHGTDDLSDRVDAVTKRSGDQVFIVYNKSKSVNRQRFSVAHELGHLQMGHVHGSSSIDLGSENFDEIEANHFAAHLLMPPDMLRKDIKDGNKDVKGLANRYQVSEEAMWWQIDKASLLKLF